MFNLAVRTCLLLLACGSWGAQGAIPAIRLAGADFTAQLPWFYHGMGFDRPQRHEIYSFEVNSLDLAPGEYRVALVPRGNASSLAVAFAGVRFEQLPVRDGRVELPPRRIDNRMLSLYVKCPLESVFIYPAGTDFASARQSAVPFTRYRRDIRLQEREILRQDSWDEFHALLRRESFGKRDLRAMFDDLLDWCRRRQVLDPRDVHYGAIYSEEDKYDFRDAAAAAVAFTYAWRDSGDPQWRRRAIAARNYAWKGQHVDDPLNPAQYGGFCQMVGGLWGTPFRRLGDTLPNVTGVETCIAVNHIVKTFDLGLAPSQEDVRRLELAARWVAASEFQPGVFHHHEGSTTDCQNSNVLGAMALSRAYHALEKLGRRPPESWLEAARRGMRHYVQGQEAIGVWPYLFATIGRGQAYDERNIPDQGMGVYHFLVACRTPTFAAEPNVADRMRRAARWWLSTSRIDRRPPRPTIDLDDRQATGSLKFSAFTWCRFLAAASLVRIAESTGEHEPWRQLALAYMEHVSTKLWNRTDPRTAPVRRATRDDMTLCSWIQAAEWDAALLRDMEEHLTAQPASPSPKRIVVDQTRRGDAGLAMALGDLSSALNAPVVYRQPGAPLPDADVVLVGRPTDTPGKAFQSAKPEQYRIGPDVVGGRQALVVEGDERGLMHGVFKLAERVRLGEPLVSVRALASPAFAWRFFAEQGQLLDLPDPSYYSQEAPFVDEARLRRETDELKKTVDSAAGLGYNALAILHVGFDDYIDYRHLDKPVYRKGDRHLLRSPVFCKYLTELCDYAHARHLEVWLQVYELQYPPQLAALYGIELKSPNLAKVIGAKIRELFERVPLDGLYVTATEAHPRCGYRSSAVWQPEGPQGAVKMMTLYADACRAVNKKIVFRLWRIAASAAAARTIVESVPDHVTLSVKNTGVDFFLSAPAAGDVITSGLPRKRPFVVIFDAFGQYDGWSRLFCYFKRNAAGVRACRDAGVLGLNAWGDWAEGCIWPDWEPGYMLAAGGKPQTQTVSWAGYWNEFRMFTRGFSPGQANAYLLARLAWDPDASLATITRDFCTLHLGAANAAPAAEALECTEDAFREECLPGVHPCYIRWTMTMESTAKEF